MRPWNPNTKSTGQPGDWTPPLRQTVPAGVHCASAHWATEAGTHVHSSSVVSDILLLCLHPLSSVAHLTTMHALSCNIWNLLQDFQYGMSTIQQLLHLLPILRRCSFGWRDWRSSYQIVLVAYLRAVCSVLTVVATILPVRCLLHCRLKQKDLDPVLHGRTRLWLLPPRRTLSCRSQSPSRDILFGCGDGTQVASWRLYLGLLFVSREGSTWH